MLKPVVISNGKVVYLHVVILLFRPQLQNGFQFELVTRQKIICTYTNEFLDLNNYFRLQLPCLVELWQDKEINQKITYKQKLKQYVYYLTSITKIQAWAIILCHHSSFLLFEFRSAAFLQTMGSQEERCCIICQLLIPQLMPSVFH